MRKKRGSGEGTIYRRPDGRWSAQITVGRKPDGTPRRITFYGKTRKEVQDQLTRFLGDAQRGIIVEPNDITVAQWLEIWLKQYKLNTLRPSTWDSYEVQVRCHLVPALGSIRLKDLKPEHLQSLYNEKLGSGLSPRSVRYIHQVIHGALDQAVKNQLLIRNVADVVELPVDRPREIRPLDLAQSKQLLSAVQQDRLYPALLLAMTTGLRRGEILALHWNDIDFKEGTLRVERTLVRVRDQSDSSLRKTKLIFGPPKTASSRRTIPIPQETLVQLRHHKTRQNQEKLLLGPAYQDQGLVFCTEDGRPIDPRNFTRHFERLLKKAGLPHFRFHDTRHTFATLLLELGVHPKVVQEMLGHSRITTTIDMYSHVSLDLEKRATQALNDLLKQKSPSAKDGLE